MFFDHGESGDPGVCQPTSYMGRRYGSDATLSGLDIVVVTRNRVIVAVEVEESFVRPKTVLGDVFGAVLGTSVRVHGRSYRLGGGVLIVAVVVGKKGRRGDKYKRLERCVGKHLSAVTAQGSGMGITKVRIIASSFDDLVRRVERLVRLEVGKALDVARSDN